MSSLFGTMSVALQSLLVQQGALEVTANNIANANTPGYSREVPILEESPPLLSGNTVLGTGVTLESVQSVRDNILNLRIDQETSQQSSLNSHVNSMNQVQALFNETQGAGLQTYLSNFFNSFQSLATNPTSSSLRQATITAGQDLAGAFSQTSQNLATIRQGLDQSVVQTVQQVNQLHRPGGQPESTNPDRLQFREQPGLAGGSTRRRLGEAFPAHRHVSGLYQQRHRVGDHHPWHSAGIRKPE